MDEIDSKILRRLLTDARSSYRKIAFELGISPPTVLNRISRLERDEVIKSYSAMVDYAKIGFDLTAVIEVTATKNKIIEVGRHISKFSNVCAVYDITGLTDLIIIAKFRNRSELSDFVKHDLSLPHIDRTNTHMVLITAKEDFRLL